MGNPEDIEGRPLTEKDVRRILKEAFPPAQLVHELRILVHEEIEKSANLAREVRFAATYAANTEDVRRSLAGEPSGRPAYDVVALWNDFYCVQRAVPPPGDNQSRDAATPAYLAFMRLFGELHRLRGVEQGLRTRLSPEKKPMSAEKYERIGKSYLRDFLMQVPADLVGRALQDCKVSPERRKVLAEAALDADLDFALKAVATIHKHLGFLEEGGEECEKALNIITATLAIAPAGSRSMRGNCTYCHAPVSHADDAGFSSPAHRACHEAHLAQRPT